MDAAVIAAEFGLGELLAAEPLAGGHAEVVKLTTARGEFVVKPAVRTRDALLHEQAALALNAAGIGQAGPIRSRAGSLLSASGHAVMRYLPGETWQVVAGAGPGTARTLATMRHLADYHLALRSVPAPAELRGATDLWARVARPGYLVRELPGLLRGCDADWAADPDGAIAAALGQVRAALPQLTSLPHQVVHGDVGPDNVVMNGDQVVAIIDFTPMYQPALAAFCSAVYWYHVIGRVDVDAAAIRASLAAVAERWPRTEAESAAWPAMLLGETLRRLATPLALAREQPPGAQPMPPATIRRRYQAVRAVIRSRSALRPGGTRRSCTDHTTARVPRSHCRHRIVQHGDHPNSTPAPSVTGVRHDRGD